MKFNSFTEIMLTLLFTITLTLAFNIQPVKAEPRTWTVDDDGPADFHTIQEAINAASSGDEIFVHNGTYYENVVVNKTLSLVGENRETTTIDGSGLGPVINVTANGVSISNFKIRSSIGPYSIGIFLISSYTVVRDNIITENGVDVLLHFSSYNIIDENIVTNASGGIVLHESSNNNLIQNNTVTRISGDAVQIWASSNNTLLQNLITNNPGYAIYLSSSYNSTLIGNTISRNSYIVIQIHTSGNNSIYRNNFVNNTGHISVYNSAGDIWDGGYPSGGNYWSDYAGVDVKSGPNQDQPSSDGIGDIPYVIDGNNRDNYPLMYPWGSPSPPSYTLTIYSSPTGVMFTVDGVSRTTPWSGTYSENSSINLIMPEIHSVGDARHYWDQWSDGITSRSRMVTVDTEITLTADLAGPYYELTVASSPITGIKFTIDGTPETTTYKEWLLEGSYLLEMPQTHNGYVWSHWLEDRDTDRIKTITLPGTTYTAVYTSPPVGGTTNSIKSEHLSSWLASVLLIISAVVASSICLRRKKES